MLVIQPHVQVLHMQAADLRGVGAAHVRGLEQHPVPQPVQRQILAGRRLQITASTLATSAAAAGRGSLRGTLMVSILSIGFARIRSWRIAQRQNRTEQGGRAPA